MERMRAPDVVGVTPHLQDVASAMGSLTRWSSWHVWGKWMTPASIRRALLRLEEVNTYLTTGDVTRNILLPKWVRVDNDANPKDQVFWWRTGGVFDPGEPPSRF